MPSTDLARAPRVFAVWVALVACSVCAHGLAGGRTSAATVLVLASLAGAPVTWLGWRQRSIAVTAPALAALQLGWHLASCATPAGAGRLAGTGAGHHQHAGVIAGTDAVTMPEGSMSTPSPVWMTLAHLAAAGLVMGALRYGERALRWLRGVGARVRRLWVAVLRTTTPPPPRSRTCWTYVVLLRDEVHRRPAQRRGPPAVEA